MPDFEQHVLTIDGMHCDACVRRVTQALGSVPGVRVHTVAIGRAQVLAQSACEPGIREAIEKTGFHMTGMQAADAKG